MFSIQEHTTKYLGNRSLPELETAALLTQVQQATAPWTQKAQDGIRRLRHAINKIQKKEGIPLLLAKEQMQREHKICIPFLEAQLSDETQFMLQYDKPESIMVVGSYARQTCLREGEISEIDLAVTMPSHLFQEKDYLNYKYFYKRTYYLACLAAGIQADKECHFDLKFARQNGNHLQPIIIAEPISAISMKKSLKPTYLIRVILSAPEGLFPISKTLPEKSCIRTRDGEIQFSVNGNAATPLYNATLRSECSVLSYLSLLDQASKLSDSYKNTCILGAVWLRQRGFGTNLSCGGIGQFEWACIIANFLVEGGFKGKSIITKNLNAYQMFKATLQFIAASDLISQPLIHYSNKLNLDLLQKPMMFDGGRGLNILFKMTPWSYHLLRHEARLSLEVMSKPLAGATRSTFLYRTSSHFTRFDYVFSLRMPLMWQPPPNSKDSTQQKEDFCRQLYDILWTALNNRVNLIHMQHPVFNPWPLLASSAAENSTIIVGLLLNPEQSLRTVDHGPSAENKPAAAKFREFWGEKAELRRFKDGRILESLVWDRTSSNNDVLKQIIVHTIHRHFKSETSDYIRFNGVTQQPLLPSDDLDSTSPIALFQPINLAYESLEVTVREMKGLPLHVRQLSAASPQLCCASYSVPLLNSPNNRMSPANVCIQFEGSARWPDDLSAIQRTKIALLLKVSEGLTQSSTGIMSRLGLENHARDMHNQAFLDVVYPSGAAFRLRIHCERELSILQNELKSRLNDQNLRNEFAKALSAYRRDFVQAPLHTQAIKTLSTRYPLLSPSIRLLKNWRDSHLLSSHFCDELIEILSVRTFVHPQPWQPPGSAMTAFLRTLTFISNWEWQSDPLIIDLHNEMSIDDIEGIKLRFKAWRKLDPAMNRTALFVASDLDPSGINWTEQSPSKVVAARFSALAKACCNLVEEQGLDCRLENLFTPSITDYDFVLHLNRKFINRSTSRPTFKNLQVQSDSEDVCSIGFDPIQLFLEELTGLFGSNVLFFHNSHETNLIAGLWNPQTGPRSWKINLTYSTMPMLNTEGAQQMITINKPATLHDIARLGGDLISRIEVKK